MSERHILEKLVEANPNAEIWWDSITGCDEYQVDKGNPEDGWETVSTGGFTKLVLVVAKVVNVKTLLTASFILSNCSLALLKAKL